MKLRTFKGSYKACYDEMDSVKSEAFYWFRCFLTLFFLPVVLHVVGYRREGKDGD